MNDQLQQTLKDPRQSCILIVDDERIVTDTLRGYLEFETEYTIYTFQSPREALKMLHERPVDVVISDYLMPEMNGLDFLSEVKRIYPDVPRIILTAYADKENAIRAINEVGLFQYVEKPWENEQFELVIRNALANKSLKETLSERIHELDKVLRQRDSLARSQEVIQEELALARQLQESMLPHQFPETTRISFVAKYLPALEIGGDFYDIFHSSQIDNRGANYVGFNHPRADALLEEIRRTIDETRRIKICRQFHRVLHEQQPYTLLFARPTFRLIDKRFKNVKIHKLGPKYWQWYVPKELQRYK